MKRIVCFTLLFALLLGQKAYALSPLQNEKLAIAAPSAILLEKETGQVL